MNGSGCPWLGFGNWRLLGKRFRDRGGNGLKGCCIESLFLIVSIAYRKYAHTVSVFRHDPIPAGGTLPHTAAGLEEITGRNESYFDVSPPSVPGSHTPHTEERTHQNVAENRHNKPLPQFHERTLFHSSESSNKIKRP